MEQMDPKPGVYPGIDRVTYESWPHVNFSTLKPFWKSPAHGRLAMVTAEKPAIWRTIGAAVHAAVLQPELFEAEYFTVPENAPQKRSNRDKAWWAAFEEANVGKVALDPADMRDVLAMRDSVFKHPRAGRIFAGSGPREFGVVWDVTTTRGPIRCKGLIDFAGGDIDGAAVVAELKTGKDASDFWFSRDVGTYGYHAQLAFYLDGLNAVLPYQRKPLIVAIESAAPFPTVVYDLDVDVIEQGRADYRWLLSRYQKCAAERVYPGYADATLRLPNWHYVVRVEE